jgi:predicted secreted acid phosphatase
MAVLQNYKGSPTIPCGIKSRLALLLVALAVANPFSGLEAKPSSDFTVPADKPEGVSYREGLAYSHTQASRDQIKKAIAAAESFCKEYERDHPGDVNKAIVSDIDETLLDNREAFVGKDDFDSAAWANWIQQSRAPVIRPTFDFLRWARKRGYAIFLITGRHEKGRHATINNLVNDGVAYDGLFMRPDGNSSCAEDNKIKQREDIEALGYKVVVNIGDQASDLVGGHSLDCEKLPNKMYFIR